MRTDNPKECCKYCEHFYPFQSYQNGDWYYSNACIMTIRVDGDKDGFVLEVDENSMCEMFVERKTNDDIRQRD